MYEVRQVLNLLQTGQTLETVMQQKLSTSYPSFESRWTAAMTAVFKPQ